MYPFPNEEILEQKERFQLLQQAMDTLPTNQRTALTLVTYDAYSYKEVAEIMDTSLSSVESLIHRAKKNVKKKLTRYYEKHL